MAPHGSWAFLVSVEHGHFPSSLQYNSDSFFPSPAFSQKKEKMTQTGIVFVLLVL
jgi:hypothetical protein